MCYYYYYYCQTGINGSQWCEQAQILKTKMIRPGPPEVKNLFRGCNFWLSELLLCPSRSLWRRAWQDRVSQQNIRPARRKLRPRPIFWSQTGLVLRPEVSDHITVFWGMSHPIWSVSLFICYIKKELKAKITFLCILSFFTILLFWFTRIKCPY